MAKKDQLYRTKYLIRDMQYAMKIMVSRLTEVDPEGAAQQHDMMIKLKQDARRLGWE